MTPSRHWPIRAVGAWLVVTALAVAGCTEAGLTSPSSPADLEGTWRLFQLTTPAGVHNESLTAGRFEVTFTNGRIGAKADCNSCGGTASLAGATLTVSNLACTLAACPSAPIDSRFTGLLNGTLTVRVNNRLLQLNSDAGELRFER